MNHNIQVKDAWQGSNSARKRLATAFQKKLGPISKSLKFDKEKCRPAERPHLTQVLQCLTAKWAAVMILYILYSTKSGYGNSIILNKYIIFYSCIIHNYEHYMMYIYNICVACNIYIYINIMTFHQVSLHLRCKSWYVVRPRCGSGSRKKWSSK
jgi:hypothetical protein